jgi:hypothetical protein
MARTPIQHRAIPATTTHTHTPWLDEVEAPSLTPDDEQPPQSDKVGSVVPQQITVSTRTVGYVGAILCALLTGGHFASLKLVAHDEQGSVNATLGRKVDDLTNQMAQMQQRQIDEQRRLIEDKRQHDELLYAILSYQLEFGRFMRENQPRAKRPEELERAERRLIELNQRR